MHRRLCVLENDVKKTDFFEYHVLYGGEDERKGIGAVGKSGGASDGGEIPLRSISDISITKMARKKEEINAGVVSAIREIETLKRRQEDLEREKTDLEDLGKKQREYETGKREVIEHLTEGIVALEKKEIQTAQLTDLVVATRNRFKEMLEEVDNLRDEGWSESEFRQELYKSLVVIEDARMEYNKSLAKVQVLDGKGDSIVERVADSDTQGGNLATRDILYWFKVGFALAVPFGIVAVVLAIAYSVLGKLIGWK